MDNLQHYSRASNMMIKGTTDTSASGLDGIGCRAALVFSRVLSYPVVHCLNNKAAFLEAIHPSSLYGFSEYGQGGSVVKVQIKPWKKKPVIAC